MTPENLTDYIALQADLAEAMDREYWARQALDDAQGNIQYLEKLIAAAARAAPYQRPTFPKD